MGIFILFAVLLILIALAIVVSPLFKTQRALCLGLIIGVPLLTLGLYLQVGNPKSLDPAFIAKNSPAPDINTAIANLQDELKSDPDNLEGWTLLARTQAATGNFEAATVSYRKAVKLAPRDADLKTELAEALLRSSKDRSFPVEAVELLKQALQDNPEHERALFFMGMHFLQSGDLAQAETYLNKLLPKLDKPAAAALIEQINVTRKQLGKPLLEMPAAETSRSLKVTVSLDDSLADIAKPGTVLFVFAKSIGGPGPPVAAKRIEVTRFPVQLELSDADSLMPTAVLSSQEKISLSARVSIKGVADASAGDIEADAIIVNTHDDKPIEIKLTRVKQ